MKAYVARASQTLQVEFDFRGFLAAVEGEQVSYLLRADLGVTLVQQASAVPGVITLSVTGDSAGRVYLFGIEAAASGGASMVLLNRLRVREPREWSSVPINAVIAPGGLVIYLRSAVDDVLLVSAVTGELLYTE